MLTFYKLKEMKKYTFRRELENRRMRRTKTK